MTTTIEYTTAKIKDFQVSTSECTDRRVKNPAVTGIEFDGDSYKATDRFWHSLYTRFGLSKSTFNYFSHEEVFARVAEKSATDRVRLCIERSPVGRPKLLAVSNPKSPVVHHDDLQELLSLHKGDKITYKNGVVESYHTPTRGRMNFAVAGDQFRNQFVLQAPIDGFGKPSIYLSLLREICSNGMVGMGATFRTQIELGREVNPLFALTRALEGFGNDEGYAALRERFEASAASWASVKESQSLYNLMGRLIGSNQLLGNDGASQDGSVEENLKRSSAFLADFHKMTGDVSAIYGASNIDMFSSKKQRVLPVNCKVYDLLNYATEVATHHAKPEGARRLQAWTGTLLTREYDLEGTADGSDSFADLLVEGSEGRKVLSSIRN